jgi:adenine-specific DNA methylase
MSQQKQTGAFYTPNEIVEYLSEQSIFQYFQKNHFPALESLNDLAKLPKKKVINILKEMQVLEPSCGSGAYCVGFLQVVKNILCQLGCKEELKNIFPMNGKDINSNAVDICILRVSVFYILNGLRETEIENKVKPKIQVQNSITGLKTSKNENLFDKVVQNQYDIVIGNPPYVQIQKLKDQQADFEKQKFETYTKMGDLYCLFYEKGMQMLKDNGILAYITSNKWMRAGYGEKLRNFFSNKNPLQLLDFGGVQVFESATVDTNILIVQNKPFQNELQACQMSKSEDFGRMNLSLYFQQHKYKLFKKKTNIMTKKAFSSFEKAFFLSFNFHFINTKFHKLWIAFIEIFIFFFFFSLFCLFFRREKTY